jgi:membrane-associated phospholipid phosphatase
MSPPAAVRSWTWSIVAVASAALFTFVAGLVATQGAPSWDISILQTMGRHQQDTARAIAKVVTATGSVPAVIVLLVAALAVLLVARLYRRAAFLAVATLLCMAASGLVKVTFGRLRPEVFARAPGNWSFPSGHTMSATGFAVALAIVLWPTRWRWPALVVATIYAVGIGLTRVYLGVHYPSDVVAGWALAVAIVALTWLAMRDWLAARDGSA